MATDTWTPSRRTLATIPQPEAARSRRYNHPLTTDPSQRPVAAGRAPVEEITR